MSKTVLKKIKNTFKFIIDPDYRFRILANRGIYNGMDDREYLERQFHFVFKEKLNLDNPRTFNEKLQWLKLYDRKPEYSIMVDKYRVREYVADIIGEEYLIPLLGVWDDPDKIDFDNLPDQFVLKCNHNSGLGMCICKDKSNLNITEVRKELRKGLNQNYYLTKREWPYKNVPRKIIAEKYMSDNATMISDWKHMVIDEQENGITQMANDLTDYKFYCFNGVVKAIGIYSDRNSDLSTKADYFDRDFNWLNFEWGYPHAVNRPKKPLMFEEMIELAEKLSKDLVQVRVDLYLCGEQIYFGELTFFDGSGLERFCPDAIDDEWGKWIKLPDLKGETVRKLIS